MADRLRGRTAVVTGAGRGIGRGIAPLLAEEGANVVVNDPGANLDGTGHDDGPAEQVVNEINERGHGKAVPCFDSVATTEGGKSMVQTALDEFGRLDILVNVAGILRFDHTHALALADWSRVIAINLTGTFLVCREAIPHLLAGRGNIVNIASTAGMTGHPWAAAYAASKGGVIAFTRALAVEYAKQGVRANSVCPGSIETPITQAFRVPEGGDPKLVRRMMPLTGFAGPPRAGFDTWASVRRRKGVNR